MIQILESRTDWHQYLLTQGAIATEQRITTQEPILKFQPQQQSFNASSTSCCYLQELRALYIKGIDAKKFLQGQLSCDLRNIQSTHSGIGTHNNISGRMLSSFRILLLTPQLTSEEESNQTYTYVLLMHHSIVEDCMTQLKKYAVFSKVNIEHAEDLIALGIQGPQASAHLDKAAPTHQHKVHTFQQQRCIQVDDTGNRFILLSTLNPIKQIWQALLLHCVADNADAWQANDILQGLAWVQQNSQDKFLPQMFNYQAVDGIGFNKGCYIGQEVIIRTQHRGHLKRSLFFIKIAADTAYSPSVGHELYQEQKNVGEIVACVRVSPEVTITLAVMHNSFSTTYGQLQSVGQTLRVIEAQALYDFKE